MGFAVHESTGITSLEQIGKERIPLRLSTGTISKEWVKYSPTMFTVSAVMKAAGFMFADIRRWGGKIQSVTRPSHPDRREALEKETINAVFDEGIKSWGQSALDAGFRYLPVQGNILKKLTVIGYRASVLPKSRFPALPADVPTVDFSGWPMVVNAAMPNDVAYALCEAIEARKALMVVQNRCFAALGWDKQVRDICQAQGIIYQGFSLLTANRAVLVDPEIRAIARRLGAGIAQVIFRFAMQIGMLPLTGTTSEQHMKEDLQAEQFMLSTEELERIETIAV